MARDLLEHQSFKSGRLTLAKPFALECNICTLLLVLCYLHSKTLGCDFKFPLRFAVLLECLVESIEAILWLLIHLCHNEALTFFKLPFDTFAVFDQHGLPLFEHIFIETSRSKLPISRTGSFALVNERLELLLLGLQRCKLRIVLCHFFDAPEESGLLECHLWRLHFLHNCQLATRDRFCP